MKRGRRSFSFAALQIAICRIPRNFEVTSVTSTTAKEYSFLPLFFFLFFFLFILFSFSFSTFFFIPLTSRRRTKFIFSAFFSDLSLQIRNRVESTTLHRSLYRTIAGTNVIKAGRRTGPIRLLVRVFTLSLFHIDSLCVFICMVTNMSK